MKIKARFEIVPEDLWIGLAIYPLANNCLMQVNFLPGCAIFMEIVREVKKDLDDLVYALSVVDDYDYTNAKNLVKNLTKKERDNLWEWIAYTSYKANDYSDIELKELGVYPVDRPKFL